MAAVLQLLTTGALWLGMGIGWLAGYTMALYRRAASDRRDARAFAKVRHRQWLQLIPRTIAAVLALFVVTVLLVRVLQTNPDLFRTPAEVPSPGASR